MLYGATGAKCSQGIIFNSEFLAKLTKCLPETISTPSGEISFCLVGYTAFKTMDVVPGTLKYA